MADVPRRDTRVPFWGKLEQGFVHREPLCGWLRPQNSYTLSLQTY